jgi:hypothetical protein
MLGLRLRIRNNGEETVWLNKIRVSSLGPPSLIFEFARDRSIFPGASVTVYLSPQEAILLPADPPERVRIALFFDGFDQPRESVRQLAPHDSPTPAGSYRFFADTDDMRFHAYYTQKNRHTGGGQFFGYDFGMRKWNPEEKAFRGNKPGTSGAQNEHMWIWGQPVYAMADGTVIRALTGLADNPAPRKRAIQRRADETSSAVEALAVTRLSDSRLASVARTTGDALEITVWETSELGAQLSRLGQIRGEEVDLIAADALTSRRLVTAVRTTSGRLKVIVWGISRDGSTISKLSERGASPVRAVTLVGLTDRRFATAVRTAENLLRLIVWELAEDGQSIKLLSHAFAGTISDLALTRLGSARLVTAVRTVQGALETIVWDVLDDGRTIDRGGEATGERIDGLAIAPLSGDRVATALRLADDRLRVVVWKISRDGETVVRGPDITAGEVQRVAACRAFGTNVATAMVTKAGTFKLILWKYNEDDDKLVRWGENDAGFTNTIDLDFIGNSVIVTGVRTVEGKLKVISWWIGSGGGNSFLLLHGDELVLYAHMREGSIPDHLARPGVTVKAGQLLGRVGNSGSSSGPHLHIHAIQAPFGMSVQDMITADATGSLPPGLSYRPLPFHNAQAMQLSKVTPGLLVDNPFSVLDDEGLYFEAMAVWPGLTTPGIPTGLSELSFHGLRASDYQTLFDRLSGAGYWVRWFDGYIVGGEQRFNLIFRPTTTDDGSAHHGLTSASYQALVEQRKTEGFRPRLVNSYLDPQGQVRYAVAFRKAGGVAWAAYHGLDTHTHQARFEELRDRGFVPVNVSVVSIDGRRRYAALYERRSVGAFRLDSSLTRSEYERLLGPRAEQGLLVSYLDAYQDLDQVRFSAIWTSELEGPMVARQNLSAAAYQQVFEEQMKAGRSTRAVVGYTLDGTQRFAGVWLE